MGWASSSSSSIVADTPIGEDRPGGSGRGSGPPTSSSAGSGLGFSTFGADFAGSLLAGVFGAEAGAGFVGAGAGVGFFGAGAGAGFFGAGAGAGFFGAGAGFFGAGAGAGFFGAGAEAGFFGAGAGAGFFGAGAGAGFLGAGDAGFVAAGASFGAGFFLGAAFGGAFLTAGFAFGAVFLAGLPTTFPAEAFFLANGLRRVVPFPDPLDFWLIYQRQRTWAGDNGAKIYGRFRAPASGSVRVAVKIQPARHYGRKGEGGGTRISVPPPFHVVGTTEAGRGQAAFASPSPFKLLSAP